MLHAREGHIGNIRGRPSTRTHAIEVAEGAMHYMWCGAGSREYPGCERCIYAPQPERLQICMTTPVCMHVRGHRLRALGLSAWRVGTSYLTG